MVITDWRLGAIGTRERAGLVDAVRTSGWRTALVSLLCAGALAWASARVDAHLVLGGMLLGAGVVALLAKPHLATMLAVALLYVNFPSIMVKQLGMPEIVAGGFILLLGFPLLQILVVRREALRADTPFYLMLLFLVAHCASSIAAVDRELAIGKIERYALEGLLLYWLIVNVVRDFATLKRAIWAVLGAASLVSMLCLYQDATGSYRQEFGGLAYRNFDADVEEQTTREDRRQKWDRAQGPVNEPNRFAQILIVLLPLAFMLYRCERSRPRRLGAAACGLMVLTGVVLTLSRGAFLALVLMTLTMMYLQWLRASRVAVFALVFLAIVPSLTTFYVKRVQSITTASSLVAGGQQADADGAIRGRATEMLAALHVFRDYPVLGVGPGQFSEFYVEKYSANPDIKFRDIRGTRRAHSLYLELAAEMGVVGVLVFLSSVVWILRGLWRWRRYWSGRNRELADLAAAFWLSLLAYLWTAIFLHLSYPRYYWFLLAIAGAAVHVLRLHASHTGGREAVALGVPYAGRHA